MEGRLLDPENECERKFAVDYINVLIFTNRVSAEEINLYKYIYGRGLYRDKPKRGENDEQSNKE